MREIEFRGKLINSGKWSYGNLDIKKTGTTIITPDETVLGTYGKVNPETIGQYIGLKDKNGKKIYEGDIVKCSFYPDYIFEIKFEEFCWYARKIPTSEYIEVSAISNCDVEVIGNIYDNPELIDKSK